MTDTFWFGWVTFWRLITGGYGWKAWVGSLIAATSSDVLYEVVKAIVLSIAHRW